MPPSMGFIGKILSWETFSGGGIISFSSSWLERNSIRKAVGNGQTARLWKDSWISLDTNLKPACPIREAYLDLKVADLLTDDLKLNKSRIQEVLPEFIAQIQCLQPSSKGAEH